MLKFAPLILAVASLLWLIGGAHGYGAIVKDYKIQNHDVTPVLGRGYSRTTGNILSSCLYVAERTEPSYDFDYFLTEVNEENSDETSMKGKIEASFSYLWVKAKIEGSMQSNSKSETKKHHIIVTMRTDRYYSSVDEISSTLSEDAAGLLSNGEFVSFFSSCGPYFIRSARRAAEITAVFSYEYSNTQEESQYRAALSADIKGGLFKMNVNGEMDFQSTKYGMSNSLQIDLKAYGLGLNLEGSSTLVARSMEDFQKVMDFAFRSMQTPGVGMVDSVEIVPWVENIQFQRASSLSLQEGCTGTNVTECAGAMPMELKKMTLMVNAEHIARMNSVMRMNYNLIFDMQQCIGDLHAFPRDYNSSELINHRHLAVPTNLDKNKNLVVPTTTVKSLNKTLTEASNNVVLAVNQFTKFFYTPCLQALGKESSGGTYNGAIFSTMYTELPECSDVQCMVPGTTVKLDNNGDKLEACYSDLEGDYAMTRAVVEEYCMPAIADLLRDLEYDG